MKKSILIISLLFCCLQSYSQQMGSFKDPRDGKSYKTVKIGKQTWFAENLAYKAKKGCWSYDNKISNVSIYGYLYSWETAKNVCPPGWYLPSDNQWDTLVNYLGGENVAGGKMKAISGWKSPIIDANNASSFNALPAGYRTESDYDKHGYYQYSGTTALFWSGSKDDYDNAWGRYLYFNNSAIGRGNDPTDEGYSVRCIKE